MSEKNNNQENQTGGFVLKTSVKGKMRSSQNGMALFKFSG